MHEMKGHVLDARNKRYAVEKRLEEALNKDGNSEICSRSLCEAARAELVESKAKVIELQLSEKRLITEMNYERGNHQKKIAESKQAIEEPILSMCSSSCLCLSFSICRIAYALQVFKQRYYRVICITPGHTVRGINAKVIDWSRNLLGTSAN